VQDHLPAKITDSPHKLLTKAAFFLPFLE